jgi:hypothetical protein
VRRRASSRELWTRWHWTCLRWLFGCLAVWQDAVTAGPKRALMRHAQFGLRGAGLVLRARRALGPFGCRWAGTPACRRQLPCWEHNKHLGRASLLAGCPPPHPHIFAVLHSSAQTFLAALIACIPHPLHPLSACAVPTPQHTYPCTTPRCARPRSSPRSLARPPRTPRLSRWASSPARRRQRAASEAPRATSQLDISRLPRWRSERRPWQMPMARCTSRSSTACSPTAGTAPAPSSQTTSSSSMALRKQAPSTRAASPYARTTLSPSAAQHAGGTA